MSSSDSDSFGRFFLVPKGFFAGAFLGAAAFMSVMGTQAAQSVQLTFVALAAGAFLAAAFFTTGSGTKPSDSLSS